MSECKRSSRALLWILRRFTPQNDMGRRAPSVILNGVKNPERLTAQRSGLSTQDSPVLCTTRESRLSECKRSSRALLWILRRFTPQNDRRRAPSVILNGVKNPERPTAQRSGLSTQDSPVLCTTRESRLSGCKRSIRAVALDSSSLHSSE